jgi:Domain of unknown function (DUF4350)
MKQRRWWIGAIVLGTILLLTLFLAPSAKNTRGSTYGRGPDGYGAWYQFMQQQGKPGQRWQRPLADLNRIVQSKSSGKSRTLLQIYAGTVEDALSYSSDLSKAQQAWVEQGNTLVMLGAKAPVTSADFKTEQPHPAGAVHIATTQRLLLDLVSSRDEATPVLSDRSGAIVWQRKMGKGKVILAVTPFLAANAYQDAPGNFSFLAQLVTQTGDRWLVDEYLHGFKDRNVITKEVAGNWLTYVLRTPLLLVLIQGVVLLALLTWAENRRFGAPQRLHAPVVDNSTAYMQALAGVLQKAESSDFILETVGKEEQLQLQRKLGLGSTILLTPDALLAAWREQTGLSTAEVETFLRGQARGQHLKDTEVKAWLENLQHLRSQI